MENKELVRLIDKYLAGECSAEEIYLVENWYGSQSPKTDTTDHRTEEQRRRSHERSFEAITAKLNTGGHSIAKDKPLIRKKLAWKWMAAASIIIFMLTSSLFYVHHNENKKSYTFTTISTGNGQIKQIKLPDGTKVWLNAGSTIKYASNYNDEKREIYLNGEAYFDVVHDKERPFDIYSGALKTHVLGTAFSVSSYPEAMAQTVAVTRGKVQVTTGKNVLAYLLPDQKLEFDENSHHYAVIAADAGKITSWKDGKLAFADMPMQDIAIHLQKWYGVKFQFKDPELKRLRLTASFNNNVSLNELLRSIYEVSHVSYRIDEKDHMITYDNVIKTPMVKTEN